MTSFTFEEKRARSVSIAEGRIIDDNSSHCSKVDDIEYFMKGVRGKYSGEIMNGKPHGSGCFVRAREDGNSLTYIGTFQNGERVGNGGYYTNGRLLGNVVWD